MNSLGNLRPVRATLGASCLVALCLPLWSRQAPWTFASSARKAAAPLRTRKPFRQPSAVALYGRYVEGLTLRNLKVDSAEPDGGPTVMLDDAARLEMTGFDSTNIPPHQHMLLFKNVAGALLYGNRASVAVECFSASSVPRAPILRYTETISTSRGTQFSSLAKSLEERCCSDGVSSH